GSPEGERHHMLGRCALAWCHSACKSENRRDCHAGSWHNAYALFLRAMFLRHRVLAYYTTVVPIPKPLSTLGAPTLTHSRKEREQNRQSCLTQQHPQRSIVNPDRLSWRTTRCKRIA